MVDIAQHITPITRAYRVLRNHEHTVSGVAVFPNGGRMVTSSLDKTLCLWDMTDGLLLKKMEGHGTWVRAVAVSGDGRLIASGDWNGELISWDGDTGISLTGAIKAHPEGITSLDFSPDGAVLATVSLDKTIKFWRTDTWQFHGNLIKVDEEIYCVQFSPSGHLIAIITDQYIQIWNPSGLECVAKLTANCFSLVWTPCGKHLLSGGDKFDWKIWEWDTSTWEQVGDPWNGHTGSISALAVNSSGTLLASASHDNYVRLWRVSDRRTVAVFSHSHGVYCITFSVDGKYILCGGSDKNITEWDLPEDVLLEDKHNAQTSSENLPIDGAEEPGTNDTSDHHYNILSINTILRDAFVTGNLLTAQELLARQINLGRRSYNAYANRSFVSSRKCDWDNALHDSLQSLSIQASLQGYVSKGIAHCGKLEFNEATKAFDLAFMFAAQDPTTTRLILLVKAIALFNANRQEEALERIKELANICPDTDTATCRVVEAYLRTQLGIKALNDTRCDEAADHFSDVINLGILSSESRIHSEYETFVIVFGWDLASSWQTAHQHRCEALFRAGKLVEAHRAYTSMMDMFDDVIKASCFEWSTAFKKECNTVYVASADAALAVSEYDEAIELYSAAIDLDGMDTLFANRCKAKLGKMSWEEALIDAEKVIELNSQSYVGFQLKHAALHGAQQYDEAIDTFEVMLSKLDDTDDPAMQAVRQQFNSPSNARTAIQTVIDAHMEDTPPRLLDTSTGRLCDREAQIRAFKMSPKYNELLSSTISFQDANIGMRRIHDVVVAFFSCVMLSHRWERKEPSLHEVQDKAIYELNSVEGIMKVQAFCKVAQNSGYRWAWIDTCCIDQKDNVELQRSVNSMFAWYRHSALTIIYLPDVSPSSQSGAMARSVWITRGWTVQEFLAPEIVLFYQNDWSLYLNDSTPNHKESPRIMLELENATGINGHALRGFSPGMRDAREKLQWASMRVTTLPEDIAYSLFGIFGVHLAVIYGEKKHNALGRLLQEIIAQSGDISCLDWVGRSSEFNSCLPASITSYAACSFVPPALSNDEMRSAVSLLRGTGAVDLASKLYTALDQLTAPRFAQRRLQLPCIVFSITEILRGPTQGEGSQFIYVVKANGLDDLLITTEDRLIPFSHAVPVRQKLLLVRLWDRNLLELQDLVESSDLVDGMQGVPVEDDQISPNSPSYDDYGASPGDDLVGESGSDTRALRLVVRLRQSFRAFLLVQQWGGEYKRIAADHDIIARVENMASVGDLMDTRMLEIL